MQLFNSKLIQIRIILNYPNRYSGYADLNLKDRVHLLEMCWTEVIVCGLVWRSTPVTEHDLLIFAPDLHFNRLDISLTLAGCLACCLATLIVHLVNKLIFRCIMIIKKCVRVCFLHCHAFLLIIKQSRLNCSPY